MPATPYDAKGLMKSAIRDNNPVVVFEDQILAASAKGPVPEEDYTVPIGVADVKRQGRESPSLPLPRWCQKRWRRLRNSP